MLQDDLRCVRLVPRKRRRNTAPRFLCRLIPLHVSHLESSVFADPQWFLDGAAEFDSAYWLRDEEVVWSKQASICCDIATA